MMTVQLNFIVKGLSLLRHGVREGAVVAGQPGALDLKYEAQHGSRMARFLPWLGLLMKEFLVHAGEHW